MIPLPTFLDALHRERMALQECAKRLGQRTLVKEVVG